MDVLDVHTAALEAVSRASKGEGPTLLECETYRYKGHGVYDSGLDYRTQQEVDEWMKRDPIQTFERKLTTENLATVEELEAIRSEVKSRLAEAVAFAKDRPYPPDDLPAKFVWA
jgi:pyruvate dehydrogenase E1 component alpha subunit